MYSIKVSHNGEVRRLQVPLDGIVATAYDQLIQTVRNIFPDLYLSKSFCLTWQDDEGDTVTVSSELELTEAIRVMSTMYGGNSLRFTVKKFETPSAVGGSASVPVSSFVAGGDRIAAAMKKEAEEAIHYGVQCDECGVSPIVGLRYKCTVRHNYDLCSGCFEKKTQPYSMIKIEDPLDKRGGRRGRGKCGRWEGMGAPHHPPHGHGPPHHHLHHGHHPHHRGHPHGGRGGRGMFHWFGGAPGEGIPYEGCEDYYGPCTEGEESNENDKKTDVPPSGPHPHHRGPFGFGGPHPPHPPHGGLFRGPPGAGPDGRTPPHFPGRGGPHGGPHPHPGWGGPWGRGRGWFGFGAGPVVVEADVVLCGADDENCCKKDEGTTAAPPAAADKEGTVIHYGVTCDCCGASPIKGFRYKCTVRDNFDVCATCYEGELQPYPMLKIVASGGEGTLVEPGAPIMRDLNDEDAGLQAAISESMSKVNLVNSKLSATTATEDEEAEEVYTEDNSFTFVDGNASTASPQPSAEEIAAKAAQEVLELLWAKELNMLADMGFTDREVLIPLLQQNIAVPASQAGDNNVNQVKAVEGMQTVVATLLLGQSVRR